MLGRSFISVLGSNVFVAQIRSGLEFLQRFERPVLSHPKIENQ
jgi:hypothetical protein